MASRYGSRLTQRDGKSSLFSAYDERQRSTSPSKNKPGSGYSSRYGGGASEPQSAFGAYPNSPYANGSPSASAAAQFRTATPDKKGRYSDAVLSELESQNDEHISGILGKVGQLKQMTIAIGDEIRDSSALAQQMNSGFEQTSLRLKGTMKRMSRMAEKTGVGWRVWLGFFAAVTVLFWFELFAPTRISGMLWKQHMASLEVSQYEIALMTRQDDKDGDQNNFPLIWYMSSAVAAPRSSIPLCGLSSLRNANVRDIFDITHNVLVDCTRLAMFSTRRNAVGELMPDLLAQDDFPTYIVKWVILGTYHDYQVRAFCAFDDEAAWKALEAQYAVARACRQWKDAQEEALRQGRPQETFTPELRATLRETRLFIDEPSIQAFMHQLSPTAGATEPEDWRAHLVYSLLWPILNTIVGCEEYERDLLIAERARLRG
ncbi:hypothetical protein EG327_010563 [Venturia inaequalis]|uniref:t-SNARE coiled-coil homology domain-containing protein n=1 Tax=Venturia inaequalis TaxID=5025 RepID=A0A8H3YTN1_VENIN|nr:hypothetical protein EG327_010563 [Venturia inaequalis]